MTVGSGVVSGLRVSHDQASLDAIETACHADQTRLVERLLADDAVTEAFALQTCNRFETYVVADDPATGQSVLSDVVSGVDPDSVVRMGHVESLRHLLRVAAGLESLVLGEDQIIGQVRDAYQDARSVGALGPVLEDAMTKAIHVGERARTETEINEGAVSIGSAAVALADREHTLDGATALVIGAGEMGTLAAHALSETPAETLLVGNRTYERAANVVEKVDHENAVAVEIDDLSTHLARADVVISATGSDGYLLDADRLAGHGETLVIDIAQPRDVAPAADDLDDVTVHDLEALESVTDDTRKKRREAAESVEEMVDDELQHLLEQYKRKRADQVIAAMYESSNRIKKRELSTALAKLDAADGLTDDQREIVESLADSLVSQLLAAPTKSLRDAAAEDDWMTINSALQLFDPEFGDDPPEFVRQLLPGDAADETPSSVPVAPTDEND